MARNGELIGQSLPNLDGVVLVTGRARYAGDLHIPGMLYGHLSRSPYAHARIVSVDASAAQDVEGVRTVIVPDDVRDLPRVTTGLIADMPLLAVDKVRYASEAVAAVVADTPEAAQHAAGLVEVSYDPLSPLLDPEEALRSDAPLVHEEEMEGVVGNRFWTQNTKVGDIEGAFANAEVVLERRFVTTKAHAMPMETHSAVAEWDENRQGVTLWTSTQQPHLVRDKVSDVFGIPQSRVRVIKPFVGGAFGHKEGLHTHEAMAIIAARRLGRPVRFVLSRSEEFSATVSRNPQIRDVKIALRSDGAVLGWRERIVQDAGAYSGLAPSVLALSEWVTVGPYKTPALDIEGVCVYTTKPPASAYRGFGNPQATFAREVMFDIAARELEMSPREFRRRNLIRESDLPSETANGLRLRTLPIEEAMDTAERAFGLDGGNPELGPYEGIGLVNMIEWGGGCRWHTDMDSDTSSVTVTLNGDGSLRVATDAADSGQGHRTMFTQIAADTLGVDAERIDFVGGDTDQSPHGLGTYGSRTSVVHGSALHRACMDLRARILAVASHQLEADPDDLEIVDGDVTVKGTDRRIGLNAVAGMLHFDRKSLPPGMEPGSQVASARYDTDCVVPDENGYGNFAANYTCSTTIARVRVDPDTGKVAVLDWGSIEDVGRAINPQLIKGQVQGGIAQGIGYALGEDMLFDESGAMRNPSMVDYQVPTAPEVPLIGDKLGSLESHDPTHPLLQKGIGESGITPAAAAIACAVYDAIGEPITTLPLTPEKVLAALERARQSRRDSA